MDPRELSKSYIERREAAREGRSVKPRRFEDAKNFRHALDRDLRREIEWHEQKLEEKRRKMEASVGKQPQRSRWWQFWKRRKPASQGWD